MFLPYPLGRSHQFVSSVPQSPQHVGLFPSWWDCSGSFPVFGSSRSADDFVVQKPELSTPSICHAPGESTLWREKRSTLTPAPSALATAGGCCVRRRCAALLCQNPTTPRTPAAHSAQVTGAASRGPGQGGPRATARASPSCKTSGPVEPHGVTCQASHQHPRQEWPRQLAS